MAASNGHAGAEIAQQFRQRFGREPQVIAQAPGRIEFIGNHTDYNRGLVLGLAIEPQVQVAVAGRADDLWRFASGRGQETVAVATETFAKAAGPGAWVNYPLGILQGLPRFRCSRPAGFDYLVHGNLPIGAGLSSSAAIELASALAFLALTRQELPRPALVSLAHWAENDFVGVPCGMLDQTVSAFGRRGQLVRIDCADADVQVIPLPAGVRFWVFNTPHKHALVDGLFAARHRECMAAAQALHVNSLREASVAMVERANLPPELRRRAQHVTAEIERVQAAVAALREGDLARVGQLLIASHRSSQRLFENSTAELDFLVNEIIKEPHVYGARLTGGGFGGAIMAMTAADFRVEQAQRVSESFQAEFGEAPQFFSTGAADGAQRVTGERPASL